MKLPALDTEARRVLVELVCAAERGPLFVLLAPAGESPANATRSAVHLLRRSGWEIDAEWLDGVRQDLLAPELAGDWRHVKVHRIRPDTWAAAREGLLRAGDEDTVDLLAEAGLDNVRNEGSAPHLRS